MTGNFFIFNPFPNSNDFYIQILGDFFYANPTVIVMFHIHPHILSFIAF